MALRAKAKIKSTNFQHFTQSFQLLCGRNSIFHTLHNPSTSIFAKLSRDFHLSKATFWSFQLFHTLYDYCYNLYLK